MTLVKRFGCVTRINEIRLVFILYIFGGFVSKDASVFQTSLPETDVPMQMDSSFKGTKTGINRNAIKGVKVEPNNVVKKSAITGKLAAKLYASRQDMDPQCR